jgi:hypothetical protein
MSALPRGIDHHAVAQARPLDSFGDRGYLAAKLMAQDERGGGHEGSHSPIFIVVDVGAAKSDPADPDENCSSLEFRPGAFLDAQIPRTMQYGRHHVSHAPSSGGSTP